MDHFFFQILEQFGVGFEQFAEFVTEFSLRAGVVRVLGEMDRRFVNGGTVLGSWQNFLPDGFVGREGRLGNFVASELATCLSGQKERERWRERGCQFSSQSYRFHTDGIELLFLKIGNREICGIGTFIWPAPFRNSNWARAISQPTPRIGLCAARN